MISCAITKLLWRPRAAERPTTKLRYEMRGLFAAALKPQLHKPNDHETPYLETGSRGYAHEPAERAHGHADLSRAAAGRRPAHQLRRARDLRHSERARRRGDFCRRVVDRLARRLSRAPAEAGHGLRTVHRSAR